LLKHKKPNASRTVRNIYESTGKKKHQQNDQDPNWKDMIAKSGDTQTSFDFSPLDPIGKGRMRAGVAYAGG